MTSRREKDPPSARAHYRSERFFQEGGNWYFSTREGTMEGPYTDKHRAVEALEKHIAIANLQLISTDSGLSMSEGSRDRQRRVH